MHNHQWAVTWIMSLCCIVQAHAAYNDTVYVDPATKPQEPTIGYFHEEKPPNAQDDLIVVKGDVKITDAYVDDVLHDGAVLLVIADNKVQVIGRGGIGATYVVEGLYDEAPPAGPGFTPDIPEWWAKARDRVAAGALVVQDIHSGYAVTDSADGPQGNPPPPDALHCDVGEDGMGDVMFSLNVSSGTYNWSLSGEENRSGVLPENDTWEKTLTDVPCGEYVLRVYDSADFERKVTVVVTNLNIVSMPEYLFADATGWVPVTIRITGLGDGPKIRNAHVRFELAGQQMFDYTVTRWGKDDGSQGDTNGESATYTLWIPITQWQGAGFTSAGTVYGDAQFIVSCDVSPHDPEEWAARESNITKDGWLATFIDQGMPVCEVGEDVAIAINVNQVGLRSAIHTAGCSCGEPRYAFPHECGTTSVHRYTCEGPTQASSGDQWWPSIYTNNAAAADTYNSVFIKSDYIFDAPWAWNAVKGRNYGTARGVYFAVSYGLKPVGTLPLGEKGMDLEKVSEAGNANMYTHGAFEYYNEGGDSDAIGSGGARSARDVFGVIGVVTAAIPALQPVTVVSGLLSIAAGAVAEVDTQVTDAWAHETSIYTLWGCRKGTGPTTYDSVYSKSEAYETEANQPVSYPMTAGNWTFCVGDSYVWLVRINSVVTGRTTYDGQWRQAGCKYTNYGGGGLNAPVQIDF